MGGIGCKVKGFDREMEERFVHLENKPNRVGN